jgi:hypothetical protein
LEFIVNELVIFKVVGYDPKRAYLLDDILDKVDFFSRVKLLSDWKIIDGKLYQAIITIKQVRNGLAHYWDESEVLYKGKNLKHCFSIFFEDIRNIFKKLINIYMLEQEKIDVDSIISEIQKIRMIDVGKCVSAIK